MTSYQSSVCGIQLSWTSTGMTKITKQKVNITNKEQAALSLKVYKDHIKNNDNDDNNTVLDNSQRDRYLNKLQYFL